MKVLHILSGTKVGGIAKFVIEFTKNTSNEVEHDFIGLGRDDTEFVKCAQNIGQVRLFKKWNFRFLRALNSLLKDNKYDVVHAHLGCWSWICLLIAKKNGVKCKIAHSHSADNFRDIKGMGKVIYLMSRIINQITTDVYFACSNHACKETFGKKILHSTNYFRILNPVNLDLFYPDVKFDKSPYLKLWNIPSEARVIGHIGYMGAHKNQQFILKLAKLLEKENIYWVLVGDGWNRAELENIVQKEGLSKVIFTGIREDISKVLNFIDVFILPSNLEGLGTVILEAQACGKKCVASTSVTQEVDLGLDLVEFINTNNIKKWMEVLSRSHSSMYEMDTIREAFDKNFCENTVSAKRIESIYKKYSSQSSAE